MNPTKLKEMFCEANFVNDLGISFESAESGNCQTRLKILPKHLQQTQVVHAGVLATIADHTAGGAATSLLRPNEYILTVEFKINLLRGSKGPTLRCEAKVIKSGKTLSFVESEVYDVTPQGEQLVAKASVTLAVMQRR